MKLAGMGRTSMTSLMVEKNFVLPDCLPDPNHQRRDERDSDGVGEKKWKIFVHAVRLCNSVSRSWALQLLRFLAKKQLSGLYICLFPAASH